MSAVASAGSKPPVTLDGWRQCAADLHRRHQALEAERTQIVGDRQNVALAAARGDAIAQRQIAKLAGREAHLHLVSTSLDHGLAVAAQEIDSHEAQAAQENREIALSKFRDKLDARLMLVGELESRILAMAPLLGQLAEITLEIGGLHASLGGTRHIIPPLAQEAVGGRLSEFMAGRGFADWLPVVRPEVRPAIASWLEAEQAVQQSYQIAA